MLKDPSSTIFSCRLQLMSVFDSAVLLLCITFLQKTYSTVSGPASWQQIIASTKSQGHYYVARQRQLNMDVCLPPTSWDTCSSDLSWFGFAPRSVHYWLYWFKSDSFRSPRLRVADSKISQMIRKCFFGIWIVFPLSLNSLSPVHTLQLRLCTGPIFGTSPRAVSVRSVRLNKSEQYQPHGIVHHKTRYTTQNWVSCGTLWHVVARCGDVETKHDALLHSVDAPWSSLSYQIEMCQKIWK